VLLSENNIDVVKNVAESFRKKLADYTLHYEGQAVDVGCSIGVAIIDSETKSTSEVMSQADVACHFAKRAGRNRVHVFNSEDANDVQTMSTDMSWSRRIKLALEKDQFLLTIQPIFDIETNEMNTYEVLIRMMDEDGSIIMPNAFLPTAERFGLAVDIDTWVIRNSIIYLSQIREFAPQTRFSVNLSAQSLSVPTITQTIPELLEQYHLDANALTFEVTETSTIANIGMAVTFLESLQRLGCLTSLDDFGSGMSSFTYLRELPVDIVKIDGKFVRDLTDSSVDQAIVKAMNEIAHALGKETVAEFVEDQSQLALLKKMGVDFAQGYYLGKPEKIESVFPLLETIRTIAH